ncbi:hypothetical protein CEXT_242821 [Caerostris extrusa]|uniref:Uncharacterized protein n=1 Tax=Caerostris extrusa TaxID=172846 RepID=A0AAV4NUG6_CAEEX|nr:hypothetical protein CEXT_242821 [Caerostris extrusa]
MMIRSLIYLHSPKSRDFRVDFVEKLKQPAFLKMPSISQKIGANTSWKISLAYPIGNESKLQAPFVTSHSESRKLHSKRKKRKSPSPFPKSGEKKKE